jgi:hypothetical protein
MSNDVCTVPLLQYCESNSNEDCDPHPIKIAFKVFPDPVSRPSPTQSTNQSPRNIVSMNNAASENGVDLPVHHSLVL